MKRFTTAIIFVAGTMLACAGCDRERSRIRSYAVPKEEVPPIEDVAGATTPAHASMPVLPAGDMRWTVPDGWAAVANTNEMRTATLRAGDGDDAVDVAITRLVGTAGGAAANINRWRGQVGLPEADQSELVSAARTVSGPGGALGIMVDLIGPETDPASEPTRMLAAIFPTRTHTWFIKAMGPRDAVERHVEGFATLCRSVTFESPGAGHAAVAADEVDVETGGSEGPSWGPLPENWVADARPRTMSVASFTVSSGAQEAVMTVTPLGGRQDVLGNVNRWRGQVGLAPLQELGEETRPIDVAGVAGHLVDLAGPSAHMIAVISHRGDQTWFYKLMGPDPLVAEQRSAFESFVRSVRFGTEER